MLRHGVPLAFGLCLLVAAVYAAEPLGKSLLLDSDPPPKPAPSAADTGVPDDYPAVGEPDPAEIEGYHDEHFDLGGVAHDDPEYDVDHAYGAGDEFGDVEEVDEAEPSYDEPPPPTRQKRPRKGQRPPPRRKKRKSKGKRRTKKQKKQRRKARKPRKPQRERPRKPSRAEPEDSEEGEEGEQDEREPDEVEEGKVTELAFQGRHTDGDDRPTPYLQKQPAVDLGGAPQGQDAPSDEGFREMREEHQHTAETPYDPTARDATVAALRASRTAAYTEAELRQPIMSALDTFTEMTLDAKLFKQYPYDLCNAWLALLPSNADAVRNRALQLLHIIRSDQADNILRQMQTEFKDLRANLDDLAMVLVHTFRASVLGLEFNRAPLTKWWDRGLKDLGLVDPNADRMESIRRVFGWNLTDASATTSLVELEHSAFTYFYMDREALSVPGISWSQVVAGYDRLRPYKTRDALDNHSWLQFEHQVYAVCNFLFLLTDRGIHFLDPVAFRDEEVFLRRALPECIHANATSLVAEVTRNLQLLGYDDSDRDVILGKTYLINRQLLGGCWSETPEAIPVLHECVSATTALLPHHPKNHWRTRFVWDKRNELVPHSKLSALYIQIGMGPHMPHPPPQVQVNKLKDEL